MTGINFSYPPIFLILIKFEKLDVTKVVGEWMSSDLFALSFNLLSKSMMSFS